MNCILCHKPTAEYIIQHYRYCTDCEIAYRDEDTITQDRQSTYGDTWVEQHSQNKGVNTRSDYLLGLMKKHLNQGCRVLDIGCASGVFVDKLNKAGYAARGVDWSRDAILYASNNMRGKFRVSNADLSGVRGYQIYDAIVASHIIEHLENPFSMLRGIQRLLKTDGLLFLTLPNLDWYDSNKSWRRISSIFDPDHVVCYGYSGLDRVLSKAGFEIIDARTRTHGINLMTAVFVALYKTIRGKREITVGGRNPKTSDGAIQKLYSAITAFSAFSTMMQIPNRLSEHNHKGMELIVIALKEGK